jgi:hypothetical protein
MTLPPRIRGISTTFVKTADMLSKADLWADCFSDSLQYPETVGKYKTTKTKKEQQADNTLIIMSPESRLISCKLP